MKTVYSFLEGHQSLADFYSALYRKIETTTPSMSESFASFTHPVLMQPEHWFEALATLEYAVRQEYDTQETNKFLVLVFGAYDCKASFDLNHTDYEFYWTKIQQVLDLYSPRSAAALLEQALQYYHPRREYRSIETYNAKLEEAASRGDETSIVLLGYHLYMGYYGTTDKERGRKLMESVTSPVQKQRVMIYQSFILLNEEGIEAAEKFSQTIDVTLLTTSLRKQYDELRALFLQLQGDKEAAAVIFRHITEYACSPLSYFYLGFSIYNQSIAGSTPQEGIRSMEEAFRCGQHEIAQYLYAAYSDEDVEWHDNERALYWLQQGYLYYDEFATSRLGKYYLSGASGEVNIEKALFYYKKGVELGSGYCMVELAIMYEDGVGVKADPVRAFEYVKDAVDVNYPYANYMLGYYYKYGTGTAENPDEAIRYLRLAAADENAKALVELALCYEEGYGLEEDGKKALELMKRAAEQHYPYATYKVGCYYLYGLEGVEEDYDESFKWISRAAEWNYPLALLELANFYLYDYADKNEQQKAFELYKKAEQAGIVNEGLGACYDYGIGVEMNEAEAFKYYLKGAEAGYCRAMYCVGRCYYFGTGIKENMTEAFRWFNDASTYYYIPATYFKGKMFLDGEGCNQNLEEGIACLQMAAAEEYAEAEFLLANCYLVGKGVEENEEKASELFEAAADHGHEQAKKITGKRRRK